MSPGVWERVGQGKMAPAGSQPSGAFKTSPTHPAVSRYISQSSQASGTFFQPTMRGPCIQRNACKWLTTHLQALHYAASQHMNPRTGVIQMNEWHTCKGALCYAEALQDIQVISSSCMKGSTPAQSPSSRRFGQRIVAPSQYLWQCLASQLHCCR